MVVQSQTETPLPPTSVQRNESPQWLIPTFIGAGLVVLTFIILFWAINRQQLMFPLWSSIAFPVLMVSPFVVLALKIPGQVKALLIILVALLLLPMLGFKDGFYLELATQIGIFAAMGLGLNIVVGFAGLLDLGYIAFFAVGAYLWGVFTSHDDTIFRLSHAQPAPEAFYLFLFGGILLAALFGILLGLPVLRLRGDYLAIVTLGFGEMIRVLISNLDNVSSNPAVRINITNGSQGLSDIASPPLPAALVDLVKNIGTALGFDIGNPDALAHQFFFYFLVIGVGILVVLIVSRLDNSPIGRAWTAIREDETAAIAMGVPLVRMKLLAFAMGAAFAGAMGVIYAAKQTAVTPESFSFIQSIFILAIVIVGGMGSIRGVLVGAIVVTLLNQQVLSNLSQLINSFKTSNQVAPFLKALAQNWPNQLDPSHYQRFVFGILLVIMMILRPAGILPASRRRMELQGAKGQEEPVELALPEMPVTTEGPAGEVIDVT